MTALNFNGVLFSLPGAKEQLWHTDGEHLFTSESDFQCWSSNSYSSEDKAFFYKNNTQSILPAHCINVFIPLVDVGPENGATEFCLGSHFHTKHFVDDIVWQDDRWKDRIGFTGKYIIL